MRILIIEAIEVCLKAKRKITSSLSSNQIKAVIDAFLLNIETDFEEVDKGVSWEVRQYFGRKYGV